MIKLAERGKMTIQHVMGEFQTRILMTRDTAFVMMDGVPIHLTVTVRPILDPVLIYVPPDMVLVLQIAPREMKMPFLMIQMDNQTANANRGTQGKPAINSSQIDIHDVTRLDEISSIAIIIDWIVSYTHIRILMEHVYVRKIGDPFMMRTLIDRHIWDGAAKNVHFVMALRISIVNNVLKMLISSILMVKFYVSAVRGTVATLVTCPLLMM